MKNQIQQIKKKRFITYFYGKKYLTRHLISECNIDATQLTNKTTKELRDMLYVCRNPINLQK